MEIIHGRSRRNGSGKEGACPSVEVGAAVGATELEAFRKNLEPLLSRFKRLFLGQ